ncbi:TraB/GumN family protein [Pedobacter sp. SYP-B3415]|uniref:TraB/GumN family protein n=1 Tax=Pedobacter sp. SYP-B3415 TaxID=2496641 RepID=UPI00101BB4AB|nr:TraB/GumN family protein [Pedobacter sp. SYP-B3415]
MKKLLLIIFLAAGLAGLRAQKPAQNQTLLWEVSGKGLEKPSYLFGTYHLIGKQFIDTMPALQKKLALSRVIVGELLFDSLNMQKMMPMMMMQDTTLNQLLSKEQYEELGTYLHDISGMPIAALNKMKPGALQLLIAAFSSPVKVKEGETIDQQIQQQGKAAGKEVIGLEQPGFQMNLLLGAPLAKQKAALLKMLDKKEQLKQQGLQLYEYYTRQQTDKMVRLFNDPEFIDKEETENILYKRNRNWLSQLPAIMKKNPAFVAVGAGHLFGSQGLIELLRNAGYTVRPLSTK